MTQKRGYLIPIGGAERRVRDPIILRRFISLCGERPRIAIIPSASRDAGMGDRYGHAFGGFGADESWILNFNHRSDCQRSDWLEKIERADGIFFAGGNQSRLARLLNGTDAADAIRAAYAGGTHVAGTSAGASYMSSHMIASGDEGAIPRARMAAMGRGLGLANGLIIDQHFRQRSRLGRLLSTLAYDPAALGLGLDEATAAFIDPDDMLEVVGRGAATIVDGSDLEYSWVGKDEGDPLSLVGVRLHVLLDGARFDLTERRVTLAPEPDEDDPGEEEEEVED
jgi:cyanophycinase